ncbi:MAG: VRR-NUC domain-containing protein [Mariprofundaceae bacterium]|nr:VRR-NUC domain-containing protein [Mariprofundaceae bacterium]
MTASEHQEQAALFRWANIRAGKEPALRYMHAIPNGGQRHIAVAVKLKAEGVKRGVPDICLPEPKGRFHGLYIELKTSKGRTSPEQKDWLEHLAKRGYKAVVCKGWIEAKETIENYLKPISGSVSSSLAEVKQST